MARPSLYLFISKTYSLLFVLCPGWSASTTPTTYNNECASELQCTVQPLAEGKRITEGKFARGQSSPANPTRVEKVPTSATIAPTSSPPQYIVREE
jgi:hypothetical protein